MKKMILLCLPVLVSVTLLGGSPKKGVVPKRYDYLYWFQVNPGHGMDTFLADSEATYISGPSFNSPTPTTRYCSNPGPYNCVVGFRLNDVNPTTNHLLPGYHFFAYVVYDRDMP